MRKSVDRVNSQTDIRPDDLLEAVHEVMHLYRVSQHRALRDGGHGVTHLEGKVLGFFARQPGATQGELVAHAGRDKGQLARLLAGLKDRGLLQAEPDPADRRTTRLQLTDAGRGVQKAIEQQRRRLATAAAAGLDGDERRRLLELLGKLRKQLEQLDQVA